MSGHRADRLVYMANQIARNLATDSDPVGAVADHIRAFWSPRMIDDLLGRADATLEPVAGEAIARLAARAGAAGG